MVSQLVFSYLSAEHKQKWHSLWQDYLVFYKTEVADIVTQTLWQRILAKDIHGFGIFKDGELIALAHCVIHPNTWHTLPVCYLEDLFVARDARRQGVATFTIEQIYHLAKENGWHRVYWVTDKDNHNAQRIYDKLADKPDVILYRRTIG